MTGNESYALEDPCELQKKGKVYPSPFYQRMFPDSRKLEKRTNAIKANNEIVSYDRFDGVKRDGPCGSRRFRVKARAPLALGYIVR